MLCHKCGVEVPDDSNFCPKCGVFVGDVSRERFSVNSEYLIGKVRELVKEGNVRRIIVRDEKENLLLDIPVTAGVLGALMTPWMAALGVITAMVTRCTIEVERKEEEE